jgi:hypothetical protein
MNLAVIEPLGVCFFVGVFVPELFSGTSSTPLDQEITIASASSSIEKRLIENRPPVDALFPGLDAGETKAIVLCWRHR